MRRAFPARTDLRRLTGRRTKASLPGASHASALAINGSPRNPILLDDPATPHFRIVNKESEVIRDVQRHYEKCRRTGSQPGQASVRSTMSLRSIETVPASFMDSSAA